MKLTDPQKKELLHLLANRLHSVVPRAPVAARSLAKLGLAAGQYAMPGRGDHWVYKLTPAGLDTAEELAKAMKPEVAIRLGVSVTCPVCDCTTTHLTWEWPTRPLAITCERCGRTYEVQGPGDES